MEKYNAAVYVRWQECDDPASVARTRADAAGLSWTFRFEDGNPGLMRRMPAGAWQESEFLVVPPAQGTAPTNDVSIVGCRPR